MTEVSCSPSRVLSGDRLSVHATAAARSPFRRLERELEQEEKLSPKVEIDQTMHAITRAWFLFNESFDENLVGWIGHIASETYPEAVDLVRNLTYSARDIERFLVLVENLPLPALSTDSTRLGLFLSALINCAKDDNFILDLSILNQVRPGSLCFSNTKNVRITGKPVSDCATGMCGGTVIVDESCSGIATGLRGGLVIVNGDATSPAAYIQGGIVMIEGKVSGHVGSEGKGGEVYHKGVRIWPTGVETK